MSRDELEAAYMASLLEKLQQVQKTTALVAGHSQESSALDLAALLEQFAIEAETDRRYAAAKSAYCRAMRQ